MGARVVIIQSYRTSGVPEWIQKCMNSVKEYADCMGYQYVVYGDAAVDEVLDEGFLEKVGDRWPMKTDLARLMFCQQQLMGGCDRVVWIDADVLLVDFKRFDLGQHLVSGFAFGKEIWIEAKGKVRRGVHNAYCAFEPDNAFLDFYIHACRAIIAQHSGERLAPHLLGPKFLKAQLPFLGDCLDGQVEMWSPDVVASFCGYGNVALYKKQRKLQGGDPVAINLCGSLLQPELAMEVVNKLRSC